MFERRNRRIRLFLIDGPTLEGIEAGRTRSDYILWCPRTLTGDEDHPGVDLSGHVEVERKRVLYKQVVLS